MKAHNPGYDYTAYSYLPAQDQFWDTTFVADLHQLSNVSYAHMPLTQESTKLWRDTLGGDHVLLGNRGPLGGGPDPKSITNKLFRPRDAWSGGLLYADGHTNFSTAFPTRPRDGESDYLIAPECLAPTQSPPPKDADITFTKQMTQAGRAVVQHD